MRYLSSLLASVLTVAIAGSTPKATLSNPVLSNSSVVASSYLPELKLPKVAPELRNSWTPELEAAFQQRAATIISYYTGRGYGNGYGENEKRSYPQAMFDFLGGNRAKAMAFLQAEDPEVAKHQHTEGIDYYYCFTLKGQIRKYFLFGEFLAPDYKQRMYSGAQKWTEIDPIGRPHPIYGLGDGTGRDWDISRRGGWVDSRNTDNLRAMREVAVYLMAEETGNEATRLLYKQKIQRYVWALYHIGMGEWDSEVYHGHTFAPYLNLYDFARDREVKKLAKAALDWFSAAAAVKYYRGGWGGPVKRDYGGGNVALASSAARSFWLYFGDTPLPNPKPELDTLYAITSTYRPPQAIVALAHKQFEKPLELLSSKPVYENWKPGNDQQPGYWETTFFGNTYQMGSLAGTFPDGDVAPFKLMADNSQRGVDYFVANTGGKWVQPGKKPGDEIGQYRNLLIWLRPADGVPFFFQLPKTALIEREKGIWFLQLEKTWLALYPINLTESQPVTIPNPKFARRYSQEQTLKATTTGNNYAGFALEVGEITSGGSYENFKDKVLRNNHLDLTKLEQGQVSLRDRKNRTLELIYNRRNLLPRLKRDGIVHNWSEHFHLYHNPESNNSPIALGWKQGHLQVKAGGLSWQMTVTKER